MMASKTKAAHLLAFNDIAAGLAVRKLTNNAIMGRGSESK
ncbi:hypothetical protein IMCC13023_03660 [Candidatus Aquiluna sp. IMCC13023]|nr:hypothetical protein IMCC13023_03660 [Candidatus Aquiluna sp. IMCC13023]